jgi:hypothetical protein
MKQPVARGRLGRRVPDRTHPERAVPDVHFEAPNLFAKAVVLGAFWIVYEYAGFFKTKNIHTYNPVRIAFHEWQAIWRDVRRPLPWKARLAYVFGPPGWSHDGSRKTTDELRAERHARHGEAP